MANRSRRVGSRWIAFPEDIELRAVERDDYPFLYQLLVERFERPGTNVVGMAPPKLPSYEEHVTHLDSARYLRCEVILLRGERVGLMLLDSAKVTGSYVAQERMGRGIGLAACYRFLETCELPVYTCMSPENRASRRTTERLGFERIEALPHKLTYELRHPPTNPFKSLRRE